MRPKAEEIRKVLSLNIKNRRRALDISQEKLAEIAGLSVQTINDIEGCRKWLSDKTITKLSEALKVEAYQLLIPNSETQNDCPDLSLTEILLILQKNLKKNVNNQIDSQFYELFKTGLFR
jgi:transcriptional regulator with XRE-family HTH domain